MELLKETLEWVLLAFGIMLMYTGLKPIMKTLLVRLPGPNAAAVPFAL